MQAEVDAKWRDLVELSSWQLRDARRGVPHATDRLDHEMHVGKLNTCPTAALELSSLIVTAIYLIEDHLIYTYIYDYICILTCLALCRRIYNYMFHTILYTDI